MINMLEPATYIELCRPYRACKEGASLICRVSPYAVLCRPVGASKEEMPLIRRIPPYAVLCRPLVLVASFHNVFY